MLLLKGFFYGLFLKLLNLTWCMCCFIQLWKGRFKVFQDEVIQHAQFLKQQHAIALQSFRNKMFTRIPKKPQLSRDLLNERKVQVM